MSIPLLTEDPSSVNDLRPRYDLGSLYAYHSPAYGTGLFRYVQFVDAVTYAAGDMVEWASATGAAVSQDKAAGSVIGRCSAGVATAVMTENYYGFMQVSGICQSILRTDGGVAAGEYMTSHATADDEADTMADGAEEQVFAFATAADGADNLSAGNAMFRNLL